jgi:hypothetical protein
VTENPHLTPLVRASARPISLLVTGSFREAMMGGGAFILLKAGRNRPESAKQAESGLAGLWKILGIGGMGVPKPSPIVEKNAAITVPTPISGGYG